MNEYDPIRFRLFNGDVCAIFFHENDFNFLQGCGLVAFSSSIYLFFFVCGQGVTPTRSASRIWPRAPLTLHRPPSPTLSLVFILFPLLPPPPHGQPTPPTQCILFARTTRNIKESRPPESSEKAVHREMRTMEIDMAVHAPTPSSPFRMTRSVSAAMSAGERNKRARSPSSPSSPGPYDRPAVCVSLHRLVLCVVCATRRGILAMERFLSLWFVCTGSRLIDLALLFFFFVETNGCL